MRRQQDGWRWKVFDPQMKAVGKKVAHIGRVIGLVRPTIYCVLRMR